MDSAAGNVMLLQATQILARGGDLGQKLEALANQAVTAAGASAAVVYVFDASAHRLEAVAQSGLDPQALAQAGQVAHDDDKELVARAVRDRQTRRAEGPTGSRALESQGRTSGLVAVPIIAADEAGNEDVEGALLVSIDGSQPETTDVDNVLGALADLCAVAIRQARLENALVERADWIGRLATIDPLTGLANRMTFDRMLELEIARAARQGTALSVVLFKVDGEVAAGQARTEARDDVLRHVASTLADQVRLVDTIARFDPDTLGLIAPGGGGAIVGARVRERAAAIEARPGQPIELIFSVAVYPAEGASSDELVASASASLEVARSAGQPVPESGEA